MSIGQTHQNQFYIFGFPGRESRTMIFILILMEHLIRTKSKGGLVNINSIFHFLLRAFVKDSKKLNIH